MAGQKKELVEYDRTAQELLASQKPKPPGKVFGLFLRITGFYDQHMQKLAAQEREQVAHARKDRAEFRAVQQNARAAFKDGLKEERREMLQSHDKARAALPQREQELTKKRVLQYMDKYQQRDQDKEDDREDEGSGAKGKLILPPDRQKAKSPDIEKQPESGAKGKLILPPSERSPEERKKLEEKKRRRAKEAQQRKDIDKDHDR